MDTVHVSVPTFSGWSATVSRMPSRGELDGPPGARHAEFGRDVVEAHRRTAAGDSMWRGGSRPETDVCRGWRDGPFIVDPPSGSADPGPSNTSQLRSKRGRREIDCRYCLAHSGPRRRGSERRGGFTQRLPCGLRCKDRRDVLGTKHTKVTKIQAVRRVGLQSRPTARGAARGNESPSASVRLVSACPRHARPPEAARRTASVFVSFVFFVAETSPRSLLPRWSRR